MIRFILILAGILLIMDAVLIALSANFNSGILFAAIAGIGLITYGAFFVKLRKIKWLRYILAAGLICACCLIALIAIYGKIDTVTYDEDALIVLGAAIRGETPAYPLYTRLEAAVSYHEKNPDAVIVVSGGQGFQETITEALAMERHLLRRGVPPDKIIKEGRATSTYENFLFAKELLDERFGRQYTAAFVTSDFHVFRAAKVARSLGLSVTHKQAAILWYTIPVNYLRECAAVLKELIINGRPHVDPHTLPGITDADMPKND
jgi:uncharacterized SAM-binding protein YcdF (DUF218 family)